MPDNNTILISPQQMHERFVYILDGLNFTEEKANAIAEIFTANSVDGIYTHGVNRFPAFVQYVKLGHVKPDATPSLHHKFGAIEQWDGNQGPGALNALHATETAMQIARQYGIGCVALANTNHWIRGGTYGWQQKPVSFLSALQIRLA
jgi:3-dehydro-L-gulonate 2-dehydrogenase